MDTVMVQIVFTAATEYGEYRDALYFTPAAYAQLKPVELATLKQARVNKWIDLIQHPPVIPPPTKEMLEQELRDLRQQKTSLDAREVELLALIAVAKPAGVKGMGE